MSVQLKVYENEAQLAELAKDRDLLEHASRFMADAFRHHPNGRLMYAAQPDGFRRAYLHRLKMLYQCIAPGSRIIFAYTPDLTASGQRTLVGLLAATPSFQAFAANSATVPDDVMTEWQATAEPLGPSNAQLINEPNPEATALGLSSWHVPLIAVRPAEQGQGIGTQLLNSFHHSIAGQASSLFSATPRLSACYGKHGYRLARHSIMTLPDGAEVDFDLLVRDPERL